MSNTSISEPTGWHEAPGITRKRRGKKWRYLTADDSPIDDAAEIRRLNAIALPPAYTDAWYSPDANARILATGIDAKGRRQYRYHPEFRAARESEKYAGCATFGEALPKIRARVARDLTGPGITRDRAIASLVRLLDTTHIRIGNEVYARENKSFGATTLRMRHAKVAGDRLGLRFRAKSGRECRMQVSDRGLARFVRAMGDLPGQHLFQWLDEAGEAHPVNSQDVNAYLQEISGQTITAKHFRTFAGSVIGFGWLAQRPQPTGGIKEMLEQVSQRLNNTPAIARKSYIHPVVVALAHDPATADIPPLPRATRWLSRVERGFLRYLDQLPGT